MFIIALGCGLPLKPTRSGAPSPPSAGSHSLNVTANDEVELLLQVLDGAAKAGKLETPRRSMPPRRMAPHSVQDALPPAPFKS